MSFDNFFKGGNGEEFDNLFFVALDIWYLALSSSVSDPLMIVRPAINEAQGAPLKRVPYYEFGNDGDAVIKERIRRQGHILQGFYSRHQEIKENFHRIKKDAKSQRGSSVAQKVNTLCRCVRTYSAFAGWGREVGELYHDRWMSVPFFDGLQLRCNDRGSVVTWSFNKSQTLDGLVQEVDNLSLALPLLQRRRWLRCRKAYGGPKKVSYGARLAGIRTIIKDRFEFDMASEVEH